VVEDEIVSLDVETDRSGERLSIQRAGRLSGVEFWTVSQSTRHWTMHHDTFTAGFVLGPRPMRAAWRYRGHEQTVSPGALQLMEPGEAHRTTQVSEPASFFVVFWSPQVLQGAAETLGMSGPVHLKCPQIEHPEITRSFARLFHSVHREREPLAVEQQLAASTHLLLQLCAEQALPARPRGVHPAMHKVRARLHAEYAESVSLDSLAAEVGISKYHLARCFKDATGVAPHQYQKLLRLQSALRFIERGGCVREAAAAAGFADEAHLSRNFRDWLGVSPGTWRRSAATQRALQPVSRGQLV
jgi:AraC-like DNA-binding protein